MLSELSKHHKEWVSIARSFGGDDFEDLVQEMYLKIINISEDKIIQNGQINKGYIWITLRNLFYDQQKNKTIRLAENFDIADDIAEIEERLAREKILYKIDKVIDTFEWYDKMIFNLHKSKGIRKLARETQISHDSIFYTVNKCRKEIKTQISEDYEDFVNKDFNLIL